MTARCGRAAVAGSIIALVALLSSAGLSLADGGRDPYPSRFVATATSQAAARQDVQRRIAAVPVPAWGKSVSPRSPLTSPQLRGRYPFYELYGLHQRWSTAFFSFRGGQQATLRWFLGHPPAGTVHVYRAAGPNRTKKWYRCLSFDLQTGRPAYGERQLALCAVKRRGRTSVRVDAISGWLEGRSRFERIPGGSRYMKVIVSEGGSDRRSAVVTDPARIDAVVDLVNSLPLLQRNTCVGELDPPSPSTPRLEVVLGSRRAGWPIARLAGELKQEGECPGLLFSLRGRGERALTEGELLVNELQGTIDRLRDGLRR